MRRLERLGWSLSAFLDHPSTDMGGRQRTTETAKLERYVCACDVYMHMYMYSYMFDICMQ